MPIPLEVISRPHPSLISCEKWKWPPGTNWWRSCFKAQRAKRKNAERGGEKGAKDGRWKMEAKEKNREECSIAALVSRMNSNSKVRLSPQT
jgi:hypothetical protein